MHFKSNNLQGILEINIPNIIISWQMTQCYQYHSSRHGLTYAKKIISLNKIIEASHSATFFFFFLRNMCNHGERVLSWVHSVLNMRVVNDINK